MAYKQVEQIAEMSDLVDASPHLRGMSWWPARLCPRKLWVAHLNLFWE